jgi:hypothetical protein
MNSEVPITADGLAIAGLLGGPAGQVKHEDLRSKWQDLKKQIGRRGDDRKKREREEMEAAEAELAKMTKAKTEDSE